MKNPTIRIKILLRAVTVLSVIGFLSAAQAQLVVDLEVSPNQKKLIATSIGSCARQPNPPGCLRASGKVQINFILKHASCGGGQSWALNSVALSNSNNGRPGNISATAAADFDAKQGSGVVTPISQSANHILIRDNNTAEYDIWYTVSASCGNATADSDPRIENDGSGHN